MSIPIKVFIDTSVFHQNGYNFESSSFSAFRTYCKSSDVSLLLPDPIEREIRRHIMEGCTDALNSLEALQKKSPFLKKLSNWPYANTNKYWLNYDLSRSLNAEFDLFLADVKAEKLGYDKVSLSAIMDRYDSCKPPFSPKKRKEFPDALSLEILSQYSAMDAAIAVITNDTDIQTACTTLPNLHTFKSIGEYLEAFNTVDNTLPQLRKALMQEVSVLDVAIKDFIRDASFSVIEDWEGTVENVEMENIEYRDFQVVSIGQHDFTVLFDAKVFYSADVNECPGVAI